MNASLGKVKISYNDEVHTISFNITYKELIEKIRTFYKDKLPQKFKIFYLDIEGDIISISCQDDLEEAQENLITSNVPIKLIIDINSQSVRESIKIDDVNRKNMQSTYIMNEKDTFINIEKEEINRYSNGLNLNLNLNSKEEEESNKTSQNKNIIDIDSQSNKLESKNKNDLKIIGENNNTITKQKVCDPSICLKCNGTGKEAIDKFCTLCQGTGRIIISYPLQESYKLRNSISNGSNENFQCKLCNKLIIGIIFKCIICKAFDICEKCENEYCHPHSLLKIRNLSMIPEILLIVPKLENSITSSNPVTENIGLYKVATIKENPKNIIKILPDTSFAKTWTFKNSGKQSWPTSTKLQILGSSGLSGKDMHIGSIHPGKEIDITQILKSPSKIGKYSQSFKMTYEDNGFKLAFGDIYYVEIEVIENDCNNLEISSNKNVKNDYLIPEEYKENVKKIMEIGIYDKEMIVNSLKKAKNDFSKAVELIFNNEGSH